MAGTPPAGSDPFAAMLQMQLPKNGDALYDQLMAKIEPELMTSQLPQLEKLYATETKEQSKARAERYQKAFAEYEKQFQAFCTDIDTKVHTYQQSARASTEHDERQADDQIVSKLLSDMSSSDS